MSTMVSKSEEKNKKIGMVASAIGHGLLILILFLSVLKYPDPPPGQLGVLVNFGDSPDVGQGEEEPSAAEAPPIEREEEPEPDPVPPEPVEEVEPEVEEEPTPPEPVDNKKVLEDKNSKELALKRQKEKEQKEKERKERQEKERKEREQKEKIRKEQERKERERKEKERKAREAREAKEREAAKLKEGIGDLFGKSKSQGNSGTPGDAGDPDGDPDGKALRGISTGTGEVGGGLSGRDVVSKPRIRDNTQKTGDVMVKICVDSQGKVTSANTTLRGSTTNDPGLVKKAKQAAQGYRFEPSSLDKQCGTVKIKFRFRK
ncbi:MAG: TonB family protein [Bacteroidota bacterium]